MSTDLIAEPAAFARSELDARLIDRLVTACHILYVEGQNDFNHGQVSARRGLTDRYWIRSAAIGFDEATADSFALCEADGRRIAGKVVVPPEWPIHSAIYRARPDVHAIVHTHAPNALVFGARPRPLEPISHDGCPFHGRLGHFDATTNTITTLDVAEHLGGVLGDGCAILLRNHGLVTAGRSVKEAIILAICLEQACAFQLKAEASGTFLASPPEDIEPKRGFIFNDVAINTYWAYFERKLGRIKQGLQLPQTRN